jgi:hypothetical protein
MMMVMMVVMEEMEVIMGGAVAVDQNLHIHVIHQFIVNKILVKKL